MTETLAAYASGQIKGSMFMAVICERMGWDYYTYQAQPKSFLDLLIGKYRIDAKNTQRANEGAQ